MRTRITDLARTAHFVPLAIATLMLGVALSFTAPYLSLFGIEQAAMSPLRLGVFMTLVSASGVCASTVLGRWSDRSGRHRGLLIASLVAAMLGYASLGFVRGYVALVAVGVVLLGPGAASLSQIFAFSRAALRIADPAQNEFASAALRTLLSLAWVFGPAVGALILAQAGFKGLFAFAAASFAASAVIALRIAETKPGLQEKAASLDSGRAVASGPPAVGCPVSNEARAANARKAIPRILIALGLIGLAANATMILLPLYLLHALHGTRLTVSAALGTGALLEIPMMLWLGSISSRLRKPKWLSASAAVHTAYFIALAAIVHPWAIVPLQVLSAAVVAITSCLGMTYIQDLMPGETGAATALFFNASRVGSILSGVLAGTVVGAFGYRAAFLMCAVLTLCAFALLAFDSLRYKAANARAAVRRA
ncbi:MFS transporter [Trinickia diaoshuihuensis]|uniref:MFS transporter n=1 Tax=Trinickia diaoshuihuensis TaxID=2292265 RepID=UPI000E248CD2|nr:MFS transporter [Trinickia diaoshuihuensis]